MQPIKKELILINPPVSNYLIRFATNLVHGVYVPVSLHILAALTPKDYKVRFIYRTFFWRKKDFTPGTLVGITCVTSSAPHAYRIAERYRKAGAFVVMGGPHVSVLPEEALGHCHSVVVGEAESVWPQVIRDFENGSLQRIYRGTPLDDFFSPVYEYFLRLPPQELRRTGILMQKGCKYHCDFCSIPSVKLRFVKIEQVVELAKRATQGRFLGALRRPTITLVGDNLFSSPPYAKDLFRALRPVRIRWVTVSSIDIAFDDEALVLARKGGCRLLLIGFESIHPRQFAKTSVHQMSSVKDYARAIRRIKSRGIAVFGSFIAGFDNYTHGDYFRMLCFLAKPMRFLFVNVTVLTPFPGCAIREQFLKEGRIKKAGWGAYTMIRVLYRPRHMSARSLQLWLLVMKITAACMSQLGLSLTVCMLSVYSFFLTSDVLERLGSYLAALFFVTYH